MNFGGDKRFWYGVASNVGSAGAPCAPAGTNCAAGMPMQTESSNTGLNLKAEMTLEQGRVLRFGGLYQKYRLDDWWPPSGSGMWPTASTRKPSTPAASIHPSEARAR